MDTTNEAGSEPVAGPVERTVRPLAHRLASQLQNAAYNCGYEDAHPSNATTRQAKADAKARETLAALYAEIDRLQAAADQHEMSPEFTDTARAALLWVLWHHQGGSSPVGQPIRFALGMGAHERMSEHQIAEAKRWAAMTRSTTAEFHNGIHAA